MIPILHDWRYYQQRGRGVYSMMVIVFGACRVFFTFCLVCAFCRAVILTRLSERVVFRRTWCVCICVCFVFVLLRRQMHHVSDSAPCLRSKRSPPEATAKILGATLMEAKTETSERYCAAHLVSLVAPINSSLS